MCSSRSLSLGWLHGSPAEILTQSHAAIRKIRKNLVSVVRQDSRDTAAPRIWPDAKCTKHDAAWLEQLLHYSRALKLRRPVWYRAAIHSAFQAATGMATWHLPNSFTLLPHLLSKMICRPHVYTAHVIIRSLPLLSSVLWSHGARLAGILGNHCSNCSGNELPLGLLWSPSRSPAPQPSHHLPSQ